MATASTPATAAPPSRGTIAKATAIALAVAAVLLATVVLPAEYGIDPLGTGRAMGLLGLTGGNTAAPPPVTAAAGGPISPQPLEYRVDSRQLTVPSLSSIEFKYELAEGAAMMYSWRATAPIDFDFHTEPAGKPASASETFERGEAAEKRALYVAPYAGVHGWYWENLNDTDVTITLETAGSFSTARMYPANAPPQDIQIPPNRQP